MPTDYNEEIGNYSSITIGSPKRMVFIETKELSWWERLDFGRLIDNLILSTTMLMCGAVLLLYLMGEI